MTLTPGVAGLNVAEVPVPAVLAGAVAGFTAAMRPAVHVATLCKDRERESAHVDFIFREDFLKGKTHYRYKMFCKEEKNSSSMKSSFSELVSIRRSAVLILPHQ